MVDILIAYIMTTSGEKENLNKNYVLFMETMKKTNIKCKIVKYLVEYCGLELNHKEITIKGSYYIIKKYYCSGQKMMTISEHFNLIYPNTLNIKTYKKKVKNNDLLDIPKVSENIEFKRIENQTYYSLKQQAINDLSNLPKKRLFCSDIKDNDGSKRFYLFSYEELWNIIKESKELHYYENYEKGEPVKLFLDIDYKIEEDSETKYKDLDELLDDVIKTIDTELNLYGISDTSKIILSSNRKDKKSAHIIYQDVHFKEISEMKTFIKNIDSDLIKEKIIDPLVYRIGCFRLYLNSKRGVNIPLTYYKGVNYKYVDEETTYYDTLLRNIKNDNFVNIKKKGKHKAFSNEIIKDTKEDDIESFAFDNEDCTMEYDVTDIEKILNMLGRDRINKYEDWLGIGMSLYNINKNYLLLWENLSKRNEEKYKKGECERKWKSFKKTKDKYGLKTLLAWAKKDNMKEYENFMSKSKQNKLMLSKYPNDNLILGETKKINELASYTELMNKKCFIKGSDHKDMPLSMYIEVLDKFMTIKCRHKECFGKIYPCNHITMTKNELNIFNNNITININNEKDVEMDMIELYEDKKLNELIYKSFSGKSSHFAEIIYYKHSNSFRYGEDEKWYMFSNHKWNKIIMKNNDEIRYTIQLTLEEIYDDVILYYKNNDNDLEKIKKVTHIKNSCMDTIMKNNILTELSVIFSMRKNPKKDLCKNFDKNRYLIGFNNGVYDLKKLEFRDGLPEDNITMTVGYDYIKEHTHNLANLNIFLEDILPNKEERDYLLTYISIGLVGNLLELFTILTNTTGRNGKSKLTDLMSQTFGEYYGCVPSQLFTRPRPDASSPDPGLLYLNDKRIVTSSEPDKKGQLNSGFIKFLTGRDSTILRKCHSNEMTVFSANFITLFICNDIPDCDEIDIAFSKRLRCVNFPTEFTENPTKPHQKKDNKTINEYFRYWNQDFMLLLIEYYKGYVKTGTLNPTEDVLKWTKLYKENTDIFLQYITENLEDSEEHELYGNIYEHFKCWFKQNNPNTKIPSTKLFSKNARRYVDIQKKWMDDNSKYVVMYKKLKYDNNDQNTINNC